MKRKFYEASSVYLLLVEKNKVLGNRVHLSNLFVAAFSPLYVNLNMSSNRLLVVI